MDSPFVYELHHNYGGNTFFELHDVITALEILGLYDNFTVDYAVVDEALKYDSYFEIAGYSIIRSPAF